MNQLELVRKAQARRDAIKKAQLVTLTYRGNKYVKQLIA
jgi:hypothetical protein